MVTAPILHLDWWKLAPYHHYYISALSVSRRKGWCFQSSPWPPILLCPSPLWHFGRSAFNDVRQMHLESKAVRITQEQNGFGIRQINIRKGRGHAEDQQHSRKIQRKAEMEVVLSESKCHENVKAVSLPPKGLVSKRHFPDSNGRGQWQIVYSKRNQH